LVLVSVLVLALDQSEAAQGGQAELVICVGSDKQRTWRCHPQRQTKPSGGDNLRRQVLAGQSG